MKFVEFITCVKYYINLWPNIINLRLINNFQNKLKSYLKCETFFLQWLTVLKHRCARRKFGVKYSLFENYRNNYANLNSMMVLQRHPAIVIIIDIVYFTIITLAISFIIVVESCWCDENEMTLAFSILPLLFRLIFHIN